MEARRVEPCSQVTKEHVTMKVSEEFQVRLSFIEAKMLLGQIT